MNQVKERRPKLSRRKRWQNVLRQAVRLPSRGDAVAGRCLGEVAEVSRASRRQYRHLFLAELDELGI
jgi:hypothetical protein